MASGALDKNLPSTEAINHSQALTDSKEAPIQQKSIPAEPGSQARLSNDETTPTGDIGRNSGELSPRGLANGLPTRSKSLKRPAQEMASTLDASPPLNGVAGKDAEQELSPTSRSVAQSDMNAAAGKSSQSDPSSPGKSGGNNQVENVADLQVGSAKRRRTTVGRPPQTNSPSGNYVEGSDAGMPADNAELSSRDQWLKQLKGGLQPVNGSSSHRILLGQVLKSDLLVGQPILYKAPSKKSADLTGVIVAGGKVACNCKDCHGNIVNLVQFEEHSGSWERYRTSNMILSNFDVSLKDVWAAVNADYKAAHSAESAQLKVPPKLRECSVCHKEGTSMVKCGGGCKKHSHASCINKEEDFRGPWFCAECLEARIQREVHKVEHARAQSARGRKPHRGFDGRRSSGRGGENPKIRPSAPRSGQAIKSQPEAAHTPRVTSKPQRLHMSAPTAKVGLSQGRLVRNSNKHKRLFNPDEPNGVKTGQKVVYQTTQGEILLHGEVSVSRDGPCGILCACCQKVISCSQFEAHAGRGSRRAPYDNIFLNGITLRKLAAALPSDPELPMARESEIVQEDMLGGCVLCDEKNFQRHGFTDLTVILCDQCEREFHVGCLRQHMGIHLEELPEGDWFCADACQRIHGDLKELVHHGAMDIDDDYQWQLMHGKDGTHGTTWALKGAHEILNDGFDPILDQITGQDLLRPMVYSEKQGEWDYTGMFTAILRHRKQAVCVLVTRVFGNMMAEVPVVSTKESARRRGHAKHLIFALENLLRKIGVRTLTLPSADATVDFWTHGLGFKHMAVDQLQTARESLRLMVFPGTNMLYKVLLPQDEPFLVAKPDKAKTNAVVAGSKTNDAAAPAEGPKATEGAEGAGKEATGEAMEGVENQAPVEAADKPAAETAEGRGVEEADRRPDGGAAPEAVENGVAEGTISAIEVEAAPSKEHAPPEVITMNGFDSEKPSGAAQHKQEVADQAAIHLQLSVGPEGHVGVQFDV